MRCGRPPHLQPCAADDEALRRVEACTGQHAVLSAAARELLGRAMPRGADARDGPSSCAAVGAGCWRAASDADAYECAPAVVRRYAY